MEAERGERWQVTQAQPVPAANGNIHPADSRRRTTGQGTSGHMLALVRLVQIGRQEHQQICTGVVLSTKSGSLWQCK